jgi:hypothetical protein
VDLLKVLGGSGLNIMSAPVNKIYEIGQRIFWMLKSLYNKEKSSKKNAVITEKLISFHALEKMLYVS